MFGDFLNTFIFREKANRPPPPKKRRCQKLILSLGGRPHIQMLSCDVNLFTEQQICILSLVIWTFRNISFVLFQVHGSHPLWHLVLYPTTLKPTCPLQPRPVCCTSAHFCVETPPSCFFWYDTFETGVGVIILRCFYKWSQRLLFWATDEEVALPLLRLLPVSLGTVS